MEPSTTFWQSVKIPGKLEPSLSFTLYSNENSNSVYKYYTDSVGRLKSEGTIQTPLELHVLMAKSLYIVHQGINFSADFPDYLLNSDDPKYNNVIPVSGPDENVEYSHHRNDLWKRDYSSYHGKESVPIPQITWGIVNQEPGVTAGKPFGTQTQEIKPRKREFVAVYSEDFKKYVGTTQNDFVSSYGKLMNFVEIKGQVFDNLIQYNIWARSAWEVEELVDWFQDYIHNYTGMFREAGIVNMYYLRRVRDDSINQIKNKYHVRSLLYYYRTEKIYINTIEPIRRIDTKVYVSSFIDKNNINPADNIIDFDNKLLSKYHNT